MKQKLINYWLINVWTKERGYEDIKLFGVDYPTKSEAKKEAKTFGKIQTITPIYLKNENF